MAKDRFSRAELGLVGTAALLVFSRVFGLSIVMPNFRGHYDATFGVDPFWIGVAFTAYAMTMAFMQFPNGVLSDKYGRRPLLLSASVLFVGGSLLAAFADSITLLIVARLVQGMGAVASVAVAAVGETLPTSRRTMGMALIGIPAGSGFLLGMISGSLLYDVISMQGLFLLTAGLGVVATLPLLGVTIPPRSADLAAPRPMTPAVVALALGGFATNYVMTTTLFFLPEGTSRVLPILMTVGLVALITLGRRIDRWGLTWQPLVLGLTLIGASSAMFILGASTLYWVGGMLFFLFHAILSMTLPSQVSRVSGPAGGRGHGIQNVVAYGGTFLAGPIAGVLAGASEYAVAIAVVVGLVAAIAIASTMRVPQPSNAGPSEPTPRE